MHRRHAPGEHLVGAAVGVLLTVCLGLGGCGKHPAAGDGASAPASVAVVPSPDLEGAEAQVIETITAARASLLEDAGSAEAWGRLGIVLDAHAFHDEAADCYRQAAELDATRFRWPYLLALTQMITDLVEAITAFEQALKLEPRSTLALSYYADTLLRAGRVDDARNAYAEAVGIDPSYRKAMLGLGELALRDGRLEEAEQHLLRALSMEFADREVHAKLARLYRQRGDTAKADREALLVKAYPQFAPLTDPLRAIVVAEGVSVRDYIDRGLSLVEQGRFQEAEAALRRAVELRPDSVRNHLNLAGMLVRVGRRREALIQCREALAFAADDAQVQTITAVVLFEDGQIDTALGHLLRALEIDPQHAAAHLNVGIIREAQSRPEEAMVSYEAAIAADPVHVEAHRRLGTLLARRGRWAEAIEHWRAAVDFDHRNVDAIFDLTTGLARVGRFGEAIAIAQQALERLGRNERVVVVLATILATCPDARYRDGKQARALADLVVQRNGTNHVPSLNLLAAAAAEAGDFDTAIGASEHALSLVRPSGQAEPIRMIEMRLALYRAGKPYHQGVETP